MALPLKYPNELPERAVRMVNESKGDYGSQFEAITSISQADRRSVNGALPATGRRGWLRLSG